MFLLPDFLMSPKQREMQRRAENWKAESALEKALPFDQIRPPPKTSRTDIGIIASSYSPENPLDEVFPQVKPAKIFKGDLLDPTGELSYSKTLLPRGTGLPVTPAPDLWRDGAMAYFTESIGIPVLRFKSNGPDARSGWDVWMSLTPNEIWSQRSGIQQATGHVVMGGLGMGWLMRQIAKKKTVTKITVVEKDKRILDWYGRKICKNTPKVDKVICADIYDVAKKFDFKKTKFLIDIWPSDSGAEFDPQLKKLREDGARVWAWGQPNAPRKSSWSSW